MLLRCTLLVFKSYHFWFFSTNLKETCPFSANLLDSLIPFLVSPYAMFGFYNFYPFNMKSRIVEILGINHFPRLFTYFLKIGYFFSIHMAMPKIILAILLKFSRTDIVTLPVPFD